MVQLNQMSSIRFTMKYDGPALVNHEMDVKELSPALFSLGELLEETNRVFNGSNTKVTVNVKAFRDGSLGIDFNLVHDILKQGLNFFNSDSVNGALNLLQVLGLVSGQGLIAIIKKIANRKIKNVIRLTSGGIKIELEDGDSLETSKEVGQIFPNMRIRKSLEMVISKPLEREGFDRVEFINGGEKEEITKLESLYFIAPELQEEPIDTQEYEISLQIISPVFQEGNKWKFSDGTASFFAEVQDQDFVKRVQVNAEAFAKDDLLRVLMERKQFEIPNGIRTQYYVKKVLTHKSALNTIPLPFSNGGNNN